MHPFPPLPEEMTATMLAPHFPELSSREIDVLLGLARAQSNKELGATLGISAETIETHVRNLTRRYSWSSRAVAQREVYRAFILRARGERG